MNRLKISWEDWEEKYKPQKNHLLASAPCNDWMYETIGAEDEYIRMILKTEPGRVWTYLDSDGLMVIGSGYHYVNRLGYFITEIPVEKDTEITVIDEEEELEHSYVPSTIKISIMYRDGNNFKSECSYDFSNEEQYTEHQIKYYLSEIADKPVIPFYYNLPDIAALNNEFLPALNDYDHSFVEIDVDAVTFDSEVSDDYYCDISTVIELIDNKDEMEIRKNVKKAEAREILEKHLENLK